MKNRFKTWLQCTVALLLLSLVVGVWAYQAQPASAAPPCSFCDQRFAHCEAGCSTQQCVDECWASIQWCYNICIE